MGFCTRSPRWSLFLSFCRCPLGCGHPMGLKCGGRFLLVHDCRLSSVLSPGSFRMGFEPLSEVSINTLWIPARFLVVFAATVSLREFSALSSVLTFPGSDTCLGYVSQFGAPSELLTHSIPRVFLVESLSAFVGGLTDAILLCPACALRFSLRRSRLSIPVALPPLSRRAFADGIYHLRVVAGATGASLPMRLVPSEPVGFAVAPPISPYTGPGQSLRSCRQPLGAQVGVYCFYLRVFPQIFMAIVYSVSLIYACPSLKSPVGLCYLGR